MVLQPLPAQRAINVHIRLSGRANQRYALLLRDYLRACSTIAQAYAQVKMGLVNYYSGGGWDDYLEDYVFNPENKKDFVAWYRLSDDRVADNKLKADKLEAILKHIYGEN